MDNNTLINIISKYITTGVLCLTKTHNDEVQRIVGFDLHPSRDEFVFKIQRDNGVRYMQVISYVTPLLHTIDVLDDDDYQLINSLYGIGRNEVRELNLNSLPYELVDSLIIKEIDVYDLIGQGLAKEL